MEKKKNWGFVVYFVVSLFIILGLIIYICYDKGIIFKSASVDNTEMKTEVTNHEKEDLEKKEEDGTQVNTPKCYGTYYGEYNGISNNGLTLDYKYTYVLNQDGTFTADFGSVSRRSGFYYINDNTISLIGTNDTVGPREENTYYNTEDYVIADDCSYILYNDDNAISFKMNKQ